MTPTQYRAAIKALGLSQERAGDWLGIGRRTSQGYALGEYPVPAPTAMYLRLCVELMADAKRKNAYAAKLCGELGLNPEDVK